MVTVEFKEIITITQGYAVLPNLSIVLIKAVWHQTEEAVCIDHGINILARCDLPFAVISPSRQAGSRLPVRHYKR